MTDIFTPFGAPQKALHLHLEEAKKSPKHLGHEYMIFEKYDGWFMYIDVTMPRLPSILAVTVCPTSTLEHGSSSGSGEHPYRAKIAINEMCFIN